MKVTQCGGQLVAKLVTNSSSTTEINLKSRKLKDLLKLWSQCPGSVVPLAMFIICIHAREGIEKVDAAYDTLVAGGHDLSQTLRRFDVKLGLI